MTSCTGQQWPWKEVVFLIHFQVLSSGFKSRRLDAATSHKYLQARQHHNLTTCLPHASWQCPSWGHSSHRVMGRAGSTPGPACCMAGQGSASPVVLGQLQWHQHPCTDAAVGSYMLGAIPACSLPALREVLAPQVGWEPCVGTPGTVLPMPPCCEEGGQWGFSPGFGGAEGDAHPWEVPDPAELHLPW